MIEQIMRTFMALRHIFVERLFYLPKPSLSWHLSISEIADIIEFIENSGQSKIDIFIGKGGG